VILTKDNLIKQNWYGSKTCVFCSHYETIKHLFFQCNFARSIWSIIQAASDLYPPTSITNIFGNWVHGIDYKYMTHLRVGAMALLWSLWLCRNDKVFNNKSSSLLQVIYGNSSTLVAATSRGGPQSLFGSMQASEGYGEIPFFTP
jgi:hypothetical protein